jgi:hypothetical protein
VQIEVLAVLPHPGALQLVDAALIDPRLVDRHARKRRRMDAAGDLVQRLRLQVSASRLVWKVLMCRRLAAV